jgi:hypothetical protein
LKSGAFDDVIRCVLTTVSFIDRPTYTALSYVWGDSKDPLAVYVGDIEVSVTTNLAMALRCIRKPDDDKVPWVDALCINQDDIEERSS